MRSRKAVLPEPLTPLVQLLDDSFRNGTDVDSAFASELPAELWDRALLDPLREFLGRPSKEFRAHLVELGFRLGGTDDGQAPPGLPLLIESLHAGSLIIDDIEDDSEWRRGDATVHRRHGVPLALNAGNWLYFWAQVQLSRLPLTDATRLLAHERLALCLLRCHEGQALDLSVRIGDLAQAQVPSIVHATTRLKTGSLLGLATFLGALAAGANGERLEAICAYGSAAGVGLQMLDDLSGIVNVQRRDKAIEDLQHGRATWAWAWLAGDLPVNTYQKLRHELREVSDPAAANLLVERMRFRLEGNGLQRARAQLYGAADRLRSVIGGGPWHDELHNEIACLEARYVQS